ncbi:hypothetical protein VIBNISOn1_1190025 [Vibrio nigripulchritudo SOn1]|uniref:Lipoprotein n=1 Tax=Vibrio nigripulchritudo SOn1 TaxID=1238450 RepID=A0AAV2VJX9_9VIBR|nr:hypothetical protein VIBNISOn1_1190025 [Vibrio nigripulchritudo SOn1]
MSFGHIVLITLASFLISCASIKPISFTGPNGKQAFAMRCSGMGRTLEMCYQKSGEICPSGYNIIAQNSSTVAVPVNGSIIAAPEHILSVECK